MRGHQCLLINSISLRDSRPGTQPAHPLSSSTGAAAPPRRPELRPFRPRLHPPAPLLLCTAEVLLLPRTPVRRRGARPPGARPGLGTLPPAPRPGLSLLLTRLPTTGPRTAKALPGAFPCVPASHSPCWENISRTPMTLRNKTKQQPCL